MKGLISRNELKPCPFCGKRAILEDWGDGNFRAACIACGASTAMRPDADKAWNRRAKLEADNE